MEFNDYYDLVQIYNPPRGWYSHKRAESYAYRLQLEKLNKEQAILRLLKDKKDGYHNRPYDLDFTPSKDKAQQKPEYPTHQSASTDWVSYFALVIAVVALLKAFA